MCIIWDSVIYPYYATIVHWIFPSNVRNAINTQIIVLCAQTTKPQSIIYEIIYKMPRLRLSAIQCCVLFAGWNIHSGAEFRIFIELLVEILCELFYSSGVCYLFFYLRFILWNSKITVNVQFSKQREKNEWTNFICCCKHRQQWICLLGFSHLYFANFCGFVSYSLLL